MGRALALLNRLARLSALDRLRLREPVRRGVYGATKAGFTAAGAGGRAFTAARRLARPERLPSASSPDLFDLTPTDEQRMIRETVAEFAAERLRPAAADADTACATPADLRSTVAELGVASLGVPEELGGLGTERSAVTNVLVAEAMAHGDMGLAVACLAPSAVSTALVLWGDVTQQATYLPAFVGSDVPVAALAVMEPQVLFDPFSLRAKAYRTTGGFMLDGVKSMVPGATSAELFVIAAELDGRGPALFIVESGTSGIRVEPEPAMGLRAAGMGRVHLDRVCLPLNALMGEGQSDVYAECVRLSRIAWCALAVGTAQAVLDYVIPYVNGRVAFGEPVSHRQGVAFKVADIGIELEGMRLLTYRAAARAERGKTFAREAGLARRLCAEQGMRIGNDGVQLLGGHGFVKEHPVERWYRDLRVIGLAEGAVLV
ncbi:acyl-CoA dehydrogenase family protein [Actinokineospora enzanensis]|uniref:acyl-CoA dehydrogenase family protein n=1 Tax=Actinokineospora enzanensis TaxID=155975 RepID=UPI000477483C|nr:acyl-CoA dehydrogenase family protein [Actinokineospora enzanensis]